jgi:hypothetical protein
MENLSSQQELYKICFLFFSKLEVDEIGRFKKPFIYLFAEVKKKIGRTQKEQDYF